MNTPKDLEQAIYAVETFEKLKVMWDEFHLDDEQQKALGNETGLYMLGKTKEERFLPNLMFRMDINRSTAEKIKERIDREIIDPVRESFEKMQNEDELESSGIEVQEKEPEQNPTQSDKQATKEELLEKVEDEEQKTDENSNYSPLNIVKEDVLKGIEDPKETPSSEFSTEGTKLDQKLDEILKKSRREVQNKETTQSETSTEMETKPNPVPENLPTGDVPATNKTAQIQNETPLQNSQKNTEDIDIEKEKNEPTSNTAPKTKYPGGQDPYREPI